MSDDSYSVSLPEAVCANTAMIRNILVHLVRVGALSAADLESLFDFTRQDLAGGRYDPDTVEGAQAYLECLHRSMSVTNILPEPDLTH